MASPHDPVFEEKVYLAFKDIFTGQRANFRKAKIVLTIINKYQNHGPVSSLLKTTSQQVVCQSLCRLLNEQIFESEAKASRRFANNPRTAVPPAPVVPEPPASDLSFLQAPNSESESDTPMVNIKYTESEEEMPAPETDSMEEYGGKSRLLVIDGTTADAFLTALSESNSAPCEEQEPEIDTPLYYKSRYPTETSQLIVHLPFSTNHLILCRVQAILEYACFQFAEERMPDILENRRWHCPKAGELNLWVAEFRKQIGTFMSNINNPEGHDISACFHLATRIRHIAVHRELVETPFLETLIKNALALCKMLGDAQALTQMGSIWECAKVQIKELESLRHEIVVELENSLDEIAARRAELDRLEETSIAEAHLRLELHHNMASDALERVLLDRDMVLFAAGKVEIEKEQDEAEYDESGQDTPQLPEKSDDQPPEKAEQHENLSRVLRILHQCAKQSASLARTLSNSHSRPVWVEYTFFALILAFLIPFMIQRFFKIHFGLDAMALA
ncbi:hypothetical protein NW755_012634 [Fusarium falciforme]|uniref:Ubiquinol-cytochrome-c reductase cytochrome c1 n=1 Tax=Fusarium falciforme TaxID=195108 RepID=A0A9W8UTN6_9HYPO|nr:hypothetical protein NW755_012634 [Fusarium falciforme]KAJ4247020.1 hypothetical protein NW757_009170 [Fusarium falciforme]